MSPARRTELARRLARGLALGLALAAACPAWALEIRGPTRGPRAAKLRVVAAAAHCVLRLPAFRDALRARDGFAESDQDGRQVLATFDQPRVCRLGTYRRGGLFGYLMYWDRVDAMHEPGAEVVKFNLNTFRDDDLPFLVGTAIHECAHLLGYRHSRNDRFRYPEIEATVPYQLGFLAEAHAPACLSGSGGPVAASDLAPIPPRAVEAAIAVTRPVETATLSAGAVTRSVETATLSAGAVTGSPATSTSSAAGTRTVETATPSAEAGIWRVEPPSPTLEVAPSDLGTPVRPLYPAAYGSQRRR